MIFDKLILRLLFYFILNILGYFYLSKLEDDAGFYEGYFYFLLLYLIVPIFEYILVRNKIFKFLYFGNIIFFFIAFYLPLPFIYNNKILMIFSDWENNKMIFEVLLYINLGLHSVILGFYTLSMIRFPSLGVSFTGIKLNKILLMFVIYLISVILLIYTGNYGITQNREVDSSQYSTILTSFLQFGIFGLILLVYYHYERKKLIYFVIILMFILGLISGLKEQAILPLLAFGVTYYFMKNTIPKKFVLIAIGFIFISFLIVGSFRAVYLSNVSKQKNLNDVSSLLSTYVSSAKEGTKDKYNYYKLSTLQIALNRLNYVPAFNKIISFTKKNGFGVPFDSHPLHILFSPVYAVFPRFLIQIKPYSNFGQYVTNVVYGIKKAKYSTGVSQTGYAYMVGGIFGVLSLMFIVGAFQGVLYKLFYKDYLPIYVYIFLSNVYVGDVIWTYTTSMIRFILILLVIFIFLANKRLIKVL